MHPGAVASKFDVPLASHVISASAVFFSRSSWTLSPEEPPFKFYGTLDAGWSDPRLGRKGTYGRVARLEEVLRGRKMHQGGGRANRNSDGLHLRF